MEFGKMIRDRRHELGLTLEEVGDIVGVGKSTVRKWEAGTIRNLRRDKIALLAKALQLEPVDLIELDHQPIEKPLELSPDEARILSIYRSLNPTGQQLALTTLESFDKNPALTEEAQAGVS